MTRRNFLKKLSITVINGIAVVCMTGCKSLHDFYSFDGSLLNGKTWTNYQSTGVSGSGPSIIKDGNSYKMWYAGTNGGTERILYATSSDGVNWSNFQLVPQRGLMILLMLVIQLSLKMDPFIKCGMPGLPELGELFTANRAME